MLVLLELANDTSFARLLVRVYLHVILWLVSLFIINLVLRLLLVYHFFVVFAHDHFRVRSKVALLNQFSPGVGSLMDNDFLWRRIINW